MKTPKVKSILHRFFVKAFKASVKNEIDDPNWLDQRDSETIPERQMLIALVDRSVRDAIERYCDIEESIDAARWFEGAYEDETDFTFLQVCEYLDIDPEAFRNHIRPMYLDLLD